MLIMDDHGPETIQPDPHCLHAVQLNHAGRPARKPSVLRAPALAVSGHHSEMNYATRRHGRAAGSPSFRRRRGFDDVAADGETADDGGLRSVKVLVQLENDSLDAIATQFFSCLSRLSSSM